MPETRVQQVKREAAELLKQPPIRLCEMVVAQRLLLAEVLPRLDRLELLLTDTNASEPWPPERGRPARQTRRG